MRPDLYAKGLFNLKAPWSSATNTVYTVIAIRSFDDIYKSGKDVYDTIYVPNGCTNGTLVDGVAFSFETERAKKIEVITLFDEVTANIIYVPTTFIMAAPNQNIIKYDHVFLSISLGAIPSTLDLTALKQDLSVFVKSRIGVTSTVDTFIMPSDTNPSPDQAAAFEIARLANVTNPGTFQSELLKAQSDLTEMQVKITEYERIIRNNNLIT